MRRAALRVVAARCHSRRRRWRRASERWRQQRELCCRPCVGCHHIVTSMLSISHMLCVTGTGVLAWLHCQSCRGGHN